MGKETLDFNGTPSGNRLHISFFGRRNAGKSSLVNAITGQNLSIVSDVKGTTTDPVSKAMELLPLGPVVITDTPGIDDEGLVGELRIERTHQVLRKTDLAVLVMDGTVGLSEEDLNLIALFQDKKIPYLVVWNKVDVSQDIPDADDSYIKVSAVTGQGIDALKQEMVRVAKAVDPVRRILGDRIGSGDVVILVTPIDSSAPKGRMILPQVQTIRDILDDMSGRRIGQMSCGVERASCTGGDRQSGFWCSEKDSTGRCETDFLLHSVCPLQRDFRYSRSRRKICIFSKGWRSGPNFRGLYPSQTV